MHRQNMTLAIEQDLLEEAHVVATRRHTTVSELVRQYLRQLVRQEKQRLEAWGDVKRLLEKPQVRLGEALPSRERLHER